jgi:hypothetical protein
MAVSLFSGLFGGVARGSFIARSSRSACMWKALGEPEEEGDLIGADEPRSADVPTRAGVGAAGALPFGSLREGIVIGRKYDIIDVSDREGRDCSRRDILTKTG